MTAGSVCGDEGHVIEPPLAFTAAELDRAGDGRRLDDEWLLEQSVSPDARTVVVGERGARLDEDRLARVPLDQPGTLLLGTEDGAPLFVTEDEDGVTDLRAAAARLAPAEAGLAAYAIALAAWHRRHTFCANCGAGTEVREGGLVRRCDACGAQHHPRTDPVVIMLVEDGNRLLLGRQASWPAGRYSALAGFVEPGETLEAAVVREVAEESGVAIGPPRYVASQPWPFPASLMLGFVAPYAGGEPRAQPGEIEDVRWFTRDELRRAAEVDSDAWTTPPGGPVPELLLPPSLAIARRLIEGWLRSS